MNIIKPLMAILIMSGLVISVPSQQRCGRNTRSKARSKTQSKDNRTPTIVYFSASSSTVQIACPVFSPVSGCPMMGSPIGVRLSASATDPDHDTLQYKYSVTGGRITGEGAEVSWELNGLSPESYVATIEVNDQRGGVAFQSISVSVIECQSCHIPCPTIDLSCPVDVEEGQAVICTVTASGGVPKIEPTYNWSLSIGTITKGQRTDTIKVDSAGLAGKQLTVTVNVGGVPPECQSYVSRKIEVRKKG